MNEKYDNLIKKLDKLNTKEKLDLSADEDLSLAIMNLVSIEEHLFFTSQKTDNDSYLDILNEVRNMRRDLMKVIVKKSEGEEWCISKHFLASSMRLFEVGNKKLANGEKKEAKALFQKAYNLYNLFWGINLKIIDTDKVKKIDDQALGKFDKKKNGISAKLGAIVKKVIDCCIE